MYVVIYIYCFEYCVFFVFVVFFFKQKTAYEMRISDWSSDVCSSDLYGGDNPLLRCAALPFGSHPRPCRDLSARRDAGADAAPVQATAGAGSRGDVRRIAQAAARAQFALSAPGPHPADGRANAVKEFVA